MSGGDQDHGGCVPRELLGVFGACRGIGRRSGATDSPRSCPALAGAGMINSRQPLAASRKKVSQNYNYPRKSSPLIHTERPEDFAFAKNLWSKEGGSAPQTIGKKRTFMKLLGRNRRFGARRAKL